MSDILSFADELLQSFAEVESRNQIQEQDTTSLQNDRGVNVYSTKCLLDDCLSPCTSKHHDETKKSTLSTKTNSSKYENTDDTNKEKNVVLEKVVLTQQGRLRGTTTSSEATKSKCEHEACIKQKVKDDKFMIAARNHLERKKSKLKEDPITASLSHHTPDKEENDKGEKIISLEMNGKQQDNTCLNSSNRLQEEDITKLVYKCLEMFIKEIQEFNSKVKTNNEQNHECIKQFAVFLDEKYIKLSLDLLPAENKFVLKIKKLISRVIEKCKKNPCIDVMQKLATVLGNENNQKSRRKSRRNTWQCLLCMKKDISVNFKNCVTCGRSRGFREKDYRKDIRGPRPMREEHAFISESEYVKKLKMSEERTIDEQKRRHYLYNKRDFQTDSRMQLKSDVSELIGSIRDFTR